jgi:hypothetical protein
MLFQSLVTVLSFWSSLAQWKVAAIAGHWHYCTVLVL